MNPTGGRILEVLDELGGVKECAARLAGEFGQPIERMERDLTEFCDSLIERGLLERSAGQGPQGAGDLGR